uniref:Uncharacterized protein n=1 Tax=Anopheles christyi TaxID=43041 RepID=A0A182KGJ3_9DIPT
MASWSCRGFRERKLCKKAVPVAFCTAPRPRTSIKARSRQVWTARRSSSWRSSSTRKMVRRFGACWTLCRSKMKSARLYFSSHRTRMSRRRKCRRCRCRTNVIAVS